MSTKKNSNNNNRERRLIAERDRNVREKDNLRSERDRLKARIRQLSKEDRGRVARKMWATIAEWAAHSAEVNLTRDSFPTASSTERFFKQDMIGRTAFTCPAGTGFAIVWNPSQCVNSMLSAAPGSAAPVGGASTAVIYTGITSTTSLAGTGATALTLAGQFSVASSAEAGTGWNRHLGAEFTIRQTTTSLIRGANVYTSNSDKEYSLFTWNSVGGAYTFAGVSDLITASHMGVQSIDFVSSTQVVRVPGYNPEPVPLYAYLARTQAVSGPATASIAEPSILPASLGMIAPCGWTRAIVVLPYDNTTAIDYVVSTRMVNETVRFTPNATLGGYDDVYTVVPDRVWVADPQAVARDRNAQAAGKAANPDGFKFSLPAVLGALGKAYRFGKGAYNMYQQFAGARPQISQPSYPMLARGGGPVITEVDEGDEYVLP